MQRTAHVVSLSAALATVCWAAAAETVPAPPNAPSTVEWNAGRGKLRLRYHDAVILDARIRAEDAAGRAVAGAEVRLQPTEPPGEKVEQRLKFVAAKPQEGVKLVLRGTVAGSEEAFPAETNGEAQKRFPLVRTSVGLSHSLRNNAVYDRRWDWVLIGPADGTTRIQPEAAKKQRISFAWESRGASIELVFRPRFYQKHRDLVYYEPWTYPVWKGSVTGYCTWWPYRDGINQQVLDSLVDVFAAKKLPDFGYKYVLDSSPLGPTRGDGDAATLLYTTGTTGTPKGVVLTHRNLLRNAESCHEHIGITEDDVFLAVLPFFHGFGLTTSMLIPLLGGNTTVCVARFSALRVFQAIAQHRVTCCFAVPAMYAELVRAGRPPGLDLSCVKILVAGGEPLRAGVAEGIHPNPRPRLRLPPGR